MINTINVEDEEISLDTARIMLLQYKSLRKYFKELTDDVLGKDYYNMGSDVYSSDRITCEDLKAKLKKRFWR